MWARKALAFEELFYFVSEKPQLQNSECRFRSKSEENIRLEIDDTFLVHFPRDIKFVGDLTMYKWKCCETDLPTIMPHFFFDSSLLSFVIFEESIRAWTTGYCFLFIPGQIVSSHVTCSWFCRSEPLPVCTKGGGMSYSTSFSYCGGDFCCFRLVRSCCPSFLWCRDLLKESLNLRGLPSSPVVVALVSRRIWIVVSLSMSLSLCFFHVWQSFRASR